MPRFGGWTERQIRRRERVFNQLVSKAARSISRTIALDMRGALTAAVTLSPEPEPTPSGWQPAGGQVAAAWAYHVDNELLPYVEDTFMDSAADVHGALEVALGVSVPKVTDALTADYIASARNRLVGVGDLVWNAVRVQLSEGYANGESIHELATRVRHVAEVTEPRARTIARTELVSATNASSLLQVKLAGFSDTECSKCWIATDDERTRIAHHQADGQCVALWQPFIVGGEGLQFPGDPSGRADNVINCRCTLDYDFHDEPTTAATDQFRWIEDEHPRDPIGQFTDKFDWLSLDDADDMHDRMQQYDPWTRDQKEALGDYTRNAYTPINMYLRGEDDEPADRTVQQAEDIHEAMRPLPRSVKVNRTIYADAFQGMKTAGDLENMIGRTFEDPGFLSTSMKQQRGFGKIERGGTFVRLELEVPVGAPAAYLAARHDLVGFEAENELLLDRGTRFKITAAHDVVGADGKTRFIVVGRVVLREDGVE